MEFAWVRLDSVPSVSLSLPTALPVTHLVG
jgi:hypothetical protein